MDASAKPMLETKPNHALLGMLSVIEGGDEALRADGPPAVDKARIADFSDSAAALNRPRGSIEPIPPQQPIPLAWRRLT